MSENKNYLKKYTWKFSELNNEDLQHWCKEQSYIFYLPFLDFCYLKHKTFRYASFISDIISLNVCYPFMCREVQHNFVCSTKLWRLKKITYIIVIFCFIILKKGKRTAETRKKICRVHREDASLGHVHVECTNHFNDYLISGDYKSLRYRRRAIAIRNRKNDRRPFVQKSSNQLSQKWPHF